MLVLSAASGTLSATARAYFRIRMRRCIGIGRLRNRGTLRLNVILGMLIIEEKVFRRTRLRP
jgi:hypothetical protein